MSIENLRTPKEVLEDMIREGELPAGLSGVTMARVLEVLERLTAEDLRRVAELIECKNAIAGMKIKEVRSILEKGE